MTSAALVGRDDAADPLAHGRERSRLVDLARRVLADEAALASPARWAMIGTDDFNASKSAVTRFVAPGPVVGRAHTRPARHLRHSRGP